MEDNLSHSQFIEFRAALAEQLKDISDRLLEIERVVNGFKWRERVIGGIAVFLLGLVSSLSVTTLDKRELITLIQERQGIIMLKVSELEKKITDLDRQFIMLHNKAIKD